MNALPADAVGRLVLLFVAPLTAELAALADRLSWPVTVIDPDRTRLDADPVPYARTCLSVSEARLDDGCDVIVCDAGRAELTDVLAAVLSGPVRTVHADAAGSLEGRGLLEQVLAGVDAPVALDLGARTPPEQALAALAGLLADRNGRARGRPPAPLS